MEGRLREQIAQWGGVSRGFGHKSHRLINHAQHGFALGRREGQQVAP
jgi:hypothetical protein